MDKLKGYMARDLKTMKNKELLKLVRKASNGSDKAFEQLIEIKSESILFSAWNMLGKYHDAEDISQEVILRMYKNIRNLKDPHAFNAWLQKIIKNECHAMKRKTSIKNEILLFEEDIDVEEIVEEDREFLPQEYSETKEQRQKIRHIIQGLPKSRRLLVVMYYYEGLSYKEIAYAMDMTMGSVAANLSRAKESIKTELEKSMDFRNSKPKSKIKGLASVPVVTQVLTEQAVEEVPRRAITELIAYSGAKVTGVASTSTASIVSGVSSVKFVGAIILSGIVATSGVAYTVNETDIFKNVKKNSQATEQRNDSHNAEKKAALTGNIEFTGEDCECGHLNPVEMSISEIDGKYESIEWKIINKTTFQEYIGKGAVVTSDIAKLKDKQLDGDYEAVYTVYYKDNKLSIKRDFSIDSGPIEPGDYE